MVYALKASDGSVAWRFDKAKDRYIGGAAMAGDLVLVPCADHTLYALQRASGALVWSFKTKAPLWAAPLVDGEVIYLPAQDHNLYALEARTGKLIWSQDLGGALSDTPVIAGGRLLAGTFGQGLAAVDLRAGKPVFTVPTDGWVWGSPVTDEAAAYFGDLAGTARAVSLQGWLDAVDLPTGRVGRRQPGAGRRRCVLRQQRRPRSRPARLPTAPPSGRSRLPDRPTPIRC